jgi:hypothetical protein
MRWSAEWSVDGVLDTSVSFLDEVWSLGESGAYWVCADDETGLAPGIYDVALLVEDEFQAGGFVFVGEDLATVDVTLRNSSTDTVCLLFASPPAATVWGPDRLGPSDLLEPGEEVGFELIAADYDVLGTDCDAATILEEPADLTTAVGSVVLEWTGSALAIDGDAPDGGAALAVGDCLNGEVGWTRENTEVVSCDAPHEQQVVGLIPFAGGDGTYPGEATLQQLGEDRCYDAFASFVGIEYDRSVWYMTAWRPSEDTWADGDRLVICALHEQNKVPITGSKEGVGE